MPLIKNIDRDLAVTQCIKLLFRTPALPARALVGFPAAPVPFQLLDNIPGKAADDGPCAWGPATHTGHRIEL